MLTSLLEFVFNYFIYHWVLALQVFHTAQIFKAITDLMADGMI